MNIKKVDLNSMERIDSCIDNFKEGKVEFDVLKGQLEEIIANNTLDKLSVEIKENIYNFIDEGNITNYPVNKYELVSEIFENNSVDSQHQTYNAYHKDQMKNINAFLMVGSAFSNPLAYEVGERLKDYDCPEMIIEDGEINAEKTEFMYLRNAYDVIMDDLVVDKEEELEKEDVEALKEKLSKDLGKDQNKSKWNSKTNIELER